MGTREDRKRGAGGKHGPVNHQATNQQTVERTIQRTTYFTNQESCLHVCALFFSLHMQMQQIWKSLSLNVSTDCAAVLSSWAMAAMLLFSHDGLIVRLVKFRPLLPPFFLNVILVFLVTAQATFTDYDSFVDPTSLYQSSTHCIKLTSHVPHLF